MQIARTVEAVPTVELTDWLDSIPVKYTYVTPVTIKFTILEDKLAEARHLARNTVVLS
jgi:hypothetical protein